MQDYLTVGLIIIFCVITMIYGLILVWVATKESKARRIHELKVARIVENNRIMIQKSQYNPNLNQTTQYNWGEHTTVMKKVQ